MTRANWLVCCAVVAMVLAESSVSAQDDIFGPVPDASQREERTPAAEKSILAHAAPAASDASSDFCQCVGEADSPSVAKIEDALQSPLKSPGLTFKDAPLEQVVKTLQDEYRIPVQIDTAALEEIGVDGQEPVNVELHGISLRAALRLMLKPLQLTYIVQDEVLIITTPEEAESQLVVCVYDVRDVAHRLPNQSVDFDQLIDTIVSCTATDTWSENGGGKAEIRPLRPGLLVISQTRAVHDEIRALLATIRAMRKRSPAPAEAKDQASAVVPATDQVVTRAYRLELGEAANPEEVRQQIRSLITSSLPDEHWQGQLDDGQPVLLTILPDRVVLRHKPSVHTQVEKLLTDSGVASAPMKITGEMRGRAGGYGMYGRGYGGYGEGRGYDGGYGSEIGGGGYGRGYSTGRGGRGAGEYGIGRGREMEEVPQPQPAEAD
jgi:hypothetical protein